MNVVVNVPMNVNVIMDVNAIMNSNKKFECDYECKCQYEWDLASERAKSTLQGAFPTAGQSR